MMKAAWAKLKTSWTQLSLREKRYLVVGTSALSIFLCYQGIFLPVTHRLTTLRDKITREEKTLAFMQAAHQALLTAAKQNQLTTKPISSIALLSVLQKKVEKMGLTSTMTQLKQGTNETVSLHFKAVNFDPLMSLFIQVTRDYSVNISHMAVTATKRPGKVNVEVELFLAPRGPSRANI